MITAPVIDVRSNVAGSWRRPTDKIGILCDPNTGDERAPQLSAPLSDVEDALAAAHDVFSSDAFEGIGLEARLVLLRDWSARLDLIVEDIAVQDAISTGNPLRTTRILASSLGDRVRSLVQQAEELGDGKLLNDHWRVRLLNRPLGPTLVLAPWNAPTFVAVSKVAAALAAGSPVLLKPSEWTPGGAQLAFEQLYAAIEDHEIPAGVAQLVHGGATVGAALASDPRVKVITFTGGLAAGRAVARASAETLAVTQLELGSNNPAIILPDADVGRTARLLVSGATRLNGQWCEAPGKVLVHDKLHDDLLEAMLAEADRLRIDHCFNDACDLGPLAYRAHRDRLNTQIAQYGELGAVTHQAGLSPDLGGWFFQPTIVTGLAAAAALDEMFGPAVTLHRVSSVEESLAAANHGGGGLDAFVFGTDEDEALRVGAKIRAGEVRINGTHMADLADGSEQTFWDAAGVGGHGPAQGVAFYQGRRVVGVDDPDLPI